LSSVYFLIDKTLGKYKVLEHIGHGGMSEVYKGEQTQLNRMVAIKVLHPFLADEEGFVVRFQREARIVATMRHPNIVQVYDFDYNDELAIYYMVMEYIDGPTLKDLLSQDRMSPREVGRIGSAIADALDYAHQRSMVHRDIKPANIMFIDDKEPVLTDFGIAKMLTLSGLTASGAMVGTPAYMAPEVGTGKAGTAYSDLYSLGVVLYEALTGSLPFDAETPMGMVMQHINDSPPPPSRFAPGIPEALESVILRALAKQPEERFSGGGEMATELRRAVGMDTLSGVQVADDAVAAPAGPSTPTETVSEKAKPQKSEVRDAIEDEYQERLVRSWPIEDQTDSPEPVPEPPYDADGDKRRDRKLPVWQRVLRVTALLLMVLALLGGVWFLSNGAILPLQGFISMGSGDAAPAGATSLESPTPTATPTTAPSSTVTPTPSPTSTPSPSPTAQAACNPRVRLDGVRIEPDETVAPGTPLVAYIALHNNGACLWPAGSDLSVASGDPLGASENFPIKSLEPGESVQLIIPLQAPEELGAYSSRWVVRRADGSTVGSSLPLEIVVSDIPPSTPTPAATVSTETLEPEPLTLAQPEVISWEDQPARNRWSGTVRLEAQGGTGTYQYYQTEVSRDTLIEDGRLSFEWRRCEAQPLSLWILSGEEIINWRGEIPYPDPESCE
jgi:serine/threonine-protein kinase